MREYLVATPKQFGAVLQGFRREQKLTQRDAGSKVGLAQSAVSEIESNPGPASLARVFKVLAALDLEIVVRQKPAAGHQAEW
jgi:HTH-type transcriptional regulator/antitoxin HipB